VSPPDPVRFVDERLGAASLLKTALRYVFPDHWSFLLGEIALYCFMVLVATGVFLALFFEPSVAETVWTGPYAPLNGAEVSLAYASALDLSFTVPGGLLMRQVHHWAALVFVVAIVLHLLRIFFTGAFRKPREPNYWIGVTLLGLAIFEGYVGYSLLDDLLSGMGLAIGYGVGMSIPGIGGPLSVLLFDGEFPGGTSFLPRLFIAHVFVVPALLAALIGVHLALIMRQKHSQFPGPGRAEMNVVGTPLWPAYTLRSVGLLAATAAVLFLLGGLVQINPVWQWGPYELYIGENGAQPDWYLGWLIGSLRLMPPLEIQAFGVTLVPNPFFGGLLFPTLVFMVLYAWPWLDRRIMGGDADRHDLLDRPRDNPRRTAFGAAFLTWVFLVFFAGSADRLFLELSVSYEVQVWIFRFAVLLVPVIAYAVVHRACTELRRGERHPWRGARLTVMRRTAAGGFEAVAAEGEEATEEPAASR
jgi:ubiquinol-cytochrome c reductase cytochrome b subunit